MRTDGDNEFTHCEVGMLHTTGWPLNPPGADIHIWVSLGRFSNRARALGRREAFIPHLEKQDEVTPSDDTMC